MYYIPDYFSDIELYSYMSNPDSSNPGSTNTVSTNPDSSNPGSSNPGSTNPGSTNPGSSNANVGAAASDGAIMATVIAGGAKLVHTQPTIAGKVVATAGTLLVGATAIGLKNVAGNITRNLGNPLIAIN